MLLDAVSFAFGGAIGTVVGYLLCALMDKEIREDEQILKVIPGSCILSNCNINCKAWELCDNKWTKNND